MGAGRKTQTVTPQNKPPKQRTSNSHPFSARNLTKKALAGVMFACKNTTHKECIAKLLFGLPSNHFQYVQKVTPGMPLFLFNCTDRKIYGIFEAASAGQMFIDRKAWTADDSETTSFPAQVRVKIRMPCRPLTEDQYKPILAKNYHKHDPHYLWFELDQDQTQKLIALMSATPVGQRSAPKWGPLFQRSLDPIGRQSSSLGLGTCTHLESSSSSSRVVSRVSQASGEKQRNATITQGKTWTSLFKVLSDSTSKEEDEDSEDSNSEGLSTMSEGGLDEDVAVEQENVTISEEKSWSSLFQLCPDSSSKEEEEEEEEDTRSNSDGLSIMSEDETPVLSESASVDEALDMSETLPVDEAPVVSEKTCYDEAPPVFAEEMALDMNSDLPSVVNKLVQTIEEMGAMQLTQTQRIQNLEQELVETNWKIQKLSDLSLSSPSNVLAKKNNSIILVGGYNGISWLPDLDWYLPSQDVMGQFNPMTSARSYASAVELKSAIYVLGGRYRTSWYDTVETYNLESNQWVSCPPLNRKKGSLAGVSLLDKIYAIGGANQADCFSEVEMLDLNVGKWVTTTSMEQKRFAPAAAELNGALYVVGGFDGHDYLDTVERFDPRALSWTKLKTMNSRRACHSLTVLNERLYAIGGYDGSRMVPTVEVFEPRVGSWIPSQPMKHARGYMGTVTFGDKIYAIGGMEEDQEILDTVECFSEGNGWELTELKSIGKRCFFSAVAV